MPGGQDALLYSTVCVRKNSHQPNEGKVTDNSIDHYVADANQSTRFESQISQRRAT